MIESFADEATEEVYDGHYPKELPSTIVKTARRKLRMVEAAAELSDLRSPPSNKLHKLSGDRRGQHAIWINTQYRVCFYWVNGNAESVEIVDYHK